MNISKEVAQELMDQLWAEGVRPNLQLIRIESIEFSVRVQRIFYERGIKTLDQLADFTEHDLLQIEGLGKLSVNEIKSFLHEAGYNLTKPSY